MKIRIVRMDGSLPSVWRLMFMRYLTLALLSSVIGLVLVLLTPIIGLALTSSLMSYLGYLEFLILFADGLFIFRPDRRCLHDLLAGTCVKDASADPASSRRAKECRGEPVPRCVRIYAWLLDKCLIMVPFYLCIKYALPALNIQVSYVRHPVITFFALYAALFLLLNGNTLVTRGQTLGKRCLGTKIVNETGELLPLWKVFLRDGFSGCRCVW